MKLIECLRCHRVSDDGMKTWHEKKSNEDWKAENVDICEGCRQLQIEEMYRDMEYANLSYWLRFLNWIGGDKWA